MTYSQFSEKMLVCLYQESVLASSLDPYVAFGHLLLKYGIPESKGYVQRLAHDWGMEGLANVDAPLGVDVSDWSAEITGRGMRHVEARYSSKDGVGTVYEAVSDVLNVPGTSIDSSIWTGLPSGFVLTEQKREALSQILTRIEHDVDALDSDNSEKAMARAYIIAARALADAPDPPTDLIWMLVQRANNLSGRASLFVSVIALFQVVTH